MFKSVSLFTLMAAVSTAGAQSSNPSDTAPITPSAPIVRADPSYRSALRQPRRPESQLVESQPVAGVWLRSESTGAMVTLSATAQRAEIRLDHGRLNVSVHHPADHAEVLIDLPGGQVSLLKDGLYTFNADTNTVRVLHGEAAAYPGPIVANANSKPTKIKEDHQLALIATAAGTTNQVKPVECFPYELTADLLQRDNHGEPGYSRYGGDYPINDPHPYYAGVWGSPYGFYPGYYGYGYPFSYGIGLGYYGGYGRGFRR